MPKEISQETTHCSDCGEPNFFVNDVGVLFLSWVQYENDSTDLLMYAALEKESWSVPKEIARGNDWFVNWADFPSLIQTTNKRLVAHWLQKSASGTYDYNVHIAQSTDNGNNWKDSFIPHRDSIAAEHGFVSMLPVEGDRSFAVWLDGRNTKVEGEAHADHDQHGHHGAMSLRAAFFDSTNALYEEAELDSKVCDCCQTAAVKTTDGILVAYRDRSDNEVRDISRVIYKDGVWSQPAAVYNDNWKIAGCPVNGPSLDAIGNDVVIAWYTMQDTLPVVKVAFSKDGGNNFRAPIRIDAGNPLGRVDVVMSKKNEAIVSWVEQTENGAAIYLGRVTVDGLVNKQLVRETKASRSSGFPRLAKTMNGICLVYISAEEEKSIKSLVVY